MTKRNCVGWCVLVALITMVLVAVSDKVGVTDCDGFTWQWYHVVEGVALFIVPFLAGILAGERK